MTPQQEEQVQRAVRGVVGRFVSRQAPADRHDMSQEAWLIAVESLPHFEEGRGCSLEGYLRVAITRSLGAEVSRWLAVPSIHNRIELGRELQHRISVGPENPDDENSVLPQILWETVDPEQILAAKQGVRCRAGWGVRFQRTLDRVLEEFEPGQRRLIERQYGLNGQPTMKVEDLARQFHWPIRDVYRTSNQFRERVYRDLSMTILDQELKELFP